MSAEFIAKTFDDTDRSNAARFIWSHVWRHKLVGFIMITGAFGNAALAALAPVLAGRAVDRVQASQSLRDAALLSLIIMATQLLRGAVQFGRNFASETFAQRIERDVRDELYVSLLGKSMTFHDFHPTGEIMARVTNDVRELNFMMNPGFNLIIGSTMFMILPLIVSPLLHPALLLVPAVFTLLYIVVQYDYIRSLHTVAQNVRVSFGVMNARMSESLDGIEVVKGTAQEEQELSKLHGLIDRVKGWFWKQGELEARYIAQLLLGLATALGFLHAAYLYDIGAIGTGDIVAFMGQLALYVFPVNTSIFTFSRVASGYAGAQRILTIINTQTELDQNAAGYDGTMEGRIQFNHASFGYLDDRQVLHDLSFEIEPGQTVAIVGQTGSGKTSIVKLINRTYDVSAGAVLVDGRNVRDWNLAALRSQISIIEQEIFLFSRTIAENIAFGRPDATRAAIIDAAQKAQAHDFIMSFNEGYDTVVGQRGVTLSGGQRQRLAIARAFLTDPRVLILDDSTSAIDSATEDLIQKAIWEAAKGRTTLLITHRLSQIRWADKIIVVRKGRVVAQGTHEDLLQTSEPYRRIFANMEALTTKIALPKSDSAAD